MDRIFTRSDLERVMGREGVDIPYSEDVSILLKPFSYKNISLSNKFVSLPMEGVDADETTGSPTEWTFRKYKRFAEGGSGLIWFEACVIDESGRSNPKQLWISKSNVGEYARLAEETKKAGFRKNGFEPKLILQLAHSGRFSRPYGKNRPIIAQRNPYLDKIQNLDNSIIAISDDELEVLSDKFIEAGKLAIKAGFDGVDMKAVHGYLVAELFGSRNRGGRFGGSYENRTAFFKKCIKSLVDEFSNKKIITTRLTVFEPSPFPYGWGVSEEGLGIDLSEPLRLIDEIKRMGVDLLGISIGYPRTNPHWNRPYNLGLVGADPSPEHPIVGVDRFIKITEEISQKNRDAVVVSAGTSWLGGVVLNVGASMLEKGMCGLVGLGRGLLAYPDMPNDLRNFGKIDVKKTCVTCSKCSQIMKDLVGKSGCVIFDKEFYHKEYMRGRK